MPCFSLAFFEQLCIWIIIAIAIWQIIQRVLPLLSVLPPIVLDIIRIVLWAVVAIIVVVLIFELIACLLGGPLRMPLVR